jgi:hypothetical protein
MHRFPCPQRYMVETEEYAMKNKRLLCLLMIFALLAPVLNQAPQANAATYLGMVTITHSYPVNLRSGGSASFPVIATGQPGDTFTCTGIDATGWYQILLPDGRTAYVSPLLSTLTGGAVPTAAPPLVYKMVTVYYRTTSGALLYTDSVYAAQGTSYIAANDARVPAGYTLTGARRVAVTVYADRSSYPAYLTFTYSRTATATPIAAVYAHVLIYYRSSNGSLLNTAYMDLSPGTRVVYANDTNVPAGYTLIGSRSAVVSVSGAGVASPWSVTYTYAPAVTAPPVITPSPAVSVPVYYMSGSGALLFSTTVLCYTGSNTVYANDGYVPTGYTLTGTRARAVTVYASGSFTPTSIVYTYSPAATATPYITVNVPVYYKTSLGTLLYGTSVVCHTGTNRVNANDSYVPAGYTLISARQAIITVSSAGYASPASVTYTYQAPATPSPVPPPVTVEVPVEYMDEFSNVFYSETAYCQTGWNTVDCNTAYAPAGYTLISSGSVNITVSAGGIASPSNVTFLFSSTGATPEPTAEAAHDVLPEYQKAHFSGTYPVYSGPDTTYFRANNGKASVSNGGVRVYGTDGDWILMGYGLTNGDYRIGYVTIDAMPAGIVTQPLVYANKPATINQQAKLTDDPIINVGALCYLPAGTPVTFLGMSDATRRWAMVELLSSDLGNVMVRGFVRADYLDIME